MARCQLGWAQGNLTCNTGHTSSRCLKVQQSVAPWPAAATSARASAAHTVRRKLSPRRSTPTMQWRDGSRAPYGWPRSRQKSAGSRACACMSGPARTHTCVHASACTHARTRVSMKASYHIMWHRTLVDPACWIADIYTWPRSQRCHEVGFTGLQIPAAKQSPCLAWLDRGPSKQKMESIIP